MKIIKMKKIIYIYFSLFNLFNFLSKGLVYGKSLSEQIAELQNDDMNEINGTLRPNFFESETKNRDEIFYNQYQKEDPLQKILPKVRFNCSGRLESYYADPDFNCEVFHYCKTNGFRFTFICPPRSIFDQKRMTCDYDKPKKEICQFSNSSNSNNHSSKRINPQWLTGEEDFSKNSTSINSVNHFVKRYQEKETSIDSESSQLIKFTQFANNNNESKNAKPLANDLKSTLYTNYDYTESSLYLDENESENDQNENNGYNLNDSYDQSGHELTPSNDEEKNFSEQEFKTLTNEKGAQRYTTSSTPIFEIKAEVVEPSKVSTLATSHLTTSRPNFFSPSNIQHFEPNDGYVWVKNVSESLYKNKLKVEPNVFQMSNLNSAFTSEPSNQINEHSNVQTSTYSNYSTTSEKVNIEKHPSYDRDYYQSDNLRDTFIPMYSNSKNFPSIRHNSNNHRNQHNQNNHSQHPQHSQHSQQSQHNQHNQNNQFNQPNKPSQINYYNRDKQNHYHSQNSFTNYDNQLSNAIPQQPSYYQQTYNQVQNTNIKPWVTYDEPQQNGLQFTGPQYSNLQSSNYYFNNNKYSKPQQSGYNSNGYQRNGLEKSNIYFKYKQDNSYGPNHVNNQRPLGQTNYQFKPSHHESFSEEEDHKYPDYFFGLPKMSGQNSPPLKYDELMQQISTAHSNSIPFSIPFDNRPYFTQQSSLSNFPFLTWLRSKNAESFLTSGSSNEHRFTYSPLFETAHTVTQPRRIPFLSSLSKLFLSNSYSKPSYLPFYQVYPKTFEQIEYPSFSSIIRSPRFPFSNVNFFQQQRLVPLYPDSQDTVLSSPLYDSFNNQTWDDNYASSSQLEQIMAPDILKIKKIFPYSEFSVRSFNENITDTNSSKTLVTSQHKRAKRSTRLIEDRIMSFPYSYPFFALNNFPFLTSFNKMLIHPLSLTSSMRPSLSFPALQTSASSPPRLRKSLQYHYIKEAYIPSLGYSIPVNFNLYPLLNVPFGHLIDPYSLLLSNFKKKFTVKTRFVPSFGKSTFFDPEFGPISIDMNELSDFGSQVQSSFLNEKHPNDLNEEEEPKYKPVSVHKSVYKRPPNRKKIPKQKPEFELKTWPYWFKDEYYKPEVKEKKEKVIITKPKSHYYEINPNKKSHLKSHPNLNSDFPSVDSYFNSLSSSYDKKNVKKSESSEVNDFTYTDKFQQTNLLNYNSDSFKILDVENFPNDYFPESPLTQTNQSHEANNFQTSTKSFSNQPYVNISSQNQKIKQNQTYTFDEPFKNNLPTSTFVYTTINSPYGSFSSQEQNQAQNVDKSFKAQNSYKREKSEMVNVPYKYKPSAYFRETDSTPTSTISSVKEWSTTVITPAPALAEFKSLKNLKSYGTRLISINKSPTFSIKTSYSLPSTQSNSDLNEMNKQAESIKKYKEQENQQEVESSYHIIFKPSAYASKSLKSKIRYQGANTFKPSAYQSSSYSTLTRQTPTHSNLTSSPSISTSFEIGLNQNLKNQSSKEMRLFHQ